jgi:transcriptional regulator with XRE-family HTH domain
MSEIDTQIDSSYNQGVLNRILLVLNEQNKTKRDLCKYAEISINSVQRWVDGSSTSFFRNIYKISEFLNVSPEYLLGKDSNTSTISDVEIMLLEKFRKLTYDKQSYIIKGIDYLIANNSD